MTAGGGRRVPRRGRVAAAVCGGLAVAVAIASSAATVIAGIAATTTEVGADKVDVEYTLSAPDLVVLSLEVEQSRQGNRASGLTEIARDPPIDRITAQTDQAIGFLTIRDAGGIDARQLVSFDDVRRRLVERLATVRAAADRSAVPPVPVGTPLPSPAAGWAAGWAVEQTYEDVISDFLDAVDVRLDAVADRPSAEVVRVAWQATGWSHVTSELLSAVLMSSATSDEPLVARDRLVEAIAAFRTTQLVLGSAGEPYDLIVERYVSDADLLVHVGEALADGVDVPDDRIGAAYASIDERADRNLRTDLFEAYGSHRGSERDAANGRFARWLTATALAGAVAGALLVVPRLWRDRRRRDRRRRGRPEPEAGTAPAGTAPTGAAPGGPTPGGPTPDGEGATTGGTRA